MQDMEGELTLQVGLGVLGGCSEELEEFSTGDLHSRFHKCSLQPSHEGCNIKKNAEERYKLH